MDLFTVDNLYQGFLSAQKRKKNKREIFYFEVDLYENLKKLRDEIVSKQYQISGYNVFTLTDKKTRTIFAPKFRDSIVQHVIYNHIYYPISNKLIHNNNGCRRGKGMHHTRDYIRKIIHKKDVNYYLQCDISKYYFSLDKQILENIIKTFIKDKDLIDLILMFAFDKGSPLGNLISQLFGLIYLNPLDWHLRKIGVKYYVRYVDDFIMFFNTKDEAKLVLTEIKEFLKTMELKLSKSKIAPTTCEIKFVGFRIQKYKCLINKRNIKSFLKNADKNKINNMISQYGLAKDTHSERFILNKMKGCLCDTLNTLI